MIRDLLRWSGGDATAANQLSSVLGIGPDTPETFINVVNLGEVFYILARRLGEETASLRVNQIRLQPVTVLPADERTVFSAARVKAHNRMSYADAFAVATATILGSILVTGDPEIRAVPGVEVRYIGG